MIPAPGGTGRICVFGTFDADRHPRIEVLARGLAAHGAEVVRCNVPWRVPTSARVAATRRPWRWPLLLVRLVACWVRLVAGARRVGPVDVVVVGYLGVLDVHLARLLWRRATLVLDHLAPATGTVEDRFGPGGWRSRIARGLDRAATRRADVTVVDTDEHREGVEGRSLVVPVGAGDAWFVEGAPEPATGPLTVVFFGLFTPLHGAVVIADAVGRALDEGAALEVTMVGGGQDEPACRAILAGRPEVRWRGWVEAAALPGLVARHDVCLGIFGTTAKAQRVVPNKVYQGAAAGCAVVTSDTPPQRRALGEAGVHVPGGDAAALAAVLLDLDRDRQRLGAARRAARARAEEAFRPAAVTATLAGELGLDPADA